VIMSRNLLNQRLSLIVLTSLFVCSCGQRPADLILTNASVYTMEEAQPWAAAVVITGNTITAVLDSDEDYAAYEGAETRVIDMAGAFIMPGFIDSHTHFDGYSSMLNDADLMAVTEDNGLIQEMKRVAAILPEGEWITRGSWDGHRLWEADWRERERLKVNRWNPHRGTIDSVTQHHPVFVNSWDRELYLANTLALRAAGLENTSIPGMQRRHDGSPTGLIREGSPAIDSIRAVIAPKSDERRLNELRAGLRELARQGITEIHDITDEPYPQYYATLQENGELTARIWMRLDLSRSAEIAQAGIEMNTHPVTGLRDRYLRYGAYKGYMDGLMGSHGALLYEPYTDDPSTSGHYRRQSSDDPDLRAPNLDKIHQMMRTGIEDGFVINTHAIGDLGISLVLDQYEQLANEFGHEAVARSRVIHAQTMRDEHYERFASLGTIAEVNPSMLEDDMRWIVRRLGPEREKLSHSFKSFIDHGVVTVGGSDIPGAQGATFKNHPKSIFNALVNRTRNDGTPEGGWLPEQRITMHDAIKMYTLDAAYSVFDEDVRGSIKVGKLADLTVTDLNLIEINPTDVLGMNVVMTVVDGRVVYEQENQ
jgi:predicted amidohydrolase YtcJ